MYVVTIRTKPDGTDGKAGRQDLMDRESSNRSRSPTEESEKLCIINVI